MNLVQIGSRFIGPDQQPFVVAEAGINHNGELDKALAMVKVAKHAGADAIKFQTFTAEEFVADPGQTYTYLSQGKEVTESMLAMFKRHEFGPAQWRMLKQACDAEGILFLSTPQNRSDLDLLLDIGIPAIKVGSDDFTNLPLLSDYASAGLPMILSCGMADIGEVHQALEAVGAFEGHPTVLLICTSQYPTPPQDANLARITTLRQAFPHVVAGFSDHTQGAQAAAVATALGACFFEKHFTLDRDLPGPDHWFSENPASLAEWTGTIRLAHALLGTPLVRPTEAERINKKEFQRHIVARRAVRRGEAFTPENIVQRRVPGGRGLPANLTAWLLGKVAFRDFSENEPIDWPSDEQDILSA